MSYLNRYLTLKNTLVFFVLLLMVFLAGNIADILLMLFAAYVLTCAVNPLVAKLQKYMPRVLAVSLILLLFLIGVLGFLIPLFAVTVKQTIFAVQNFPNYIDNIQSILNFKFFGFSLAKIINTEALKVDTSQVVGNLVSHSIEAGKIVANSFTTIFAVAIMIFYLALDESHIKNAFIAFFPQKYKQRAGEIVDTISERVGGYVFAQILSMAFVGFLTMIGLLLIGHKHALILGFLTFILDLVPVIGPAIAVIAGVLSATGHGFLFVFLTFAIFMVVQWLENQLLRPVIFAKLMDMHPLTIIISLLVGARFLGFWGVILGPAIASVICVLVDELYLKRIKEQAN